MIQRREIEEAIVKLAGMLNEYSVLNGYLITHAPDVPAGSDPRVPITDDDYAVTLHRTIEPMIKILQTTLGDEHADWLTELEWQNALALARAINGGVL